MSEGSYRSLDFGELSDAFEHNPALAGVLRPTVATGSVDPDHDAHGVFLAALGPDTVSTCATLVPLSANPVWDVNGYYRACGVPWPYKPSKGMLRRCYEASGGQEDDYATYAFKRLLDKEFRRHYDARPPCAPVDDEYRWRNLRRMAAEWAASQSLATGKTVTVRDLLGDDIIGRMEAEAAEQERRAKEAAEEDSSSPERPKSQDVDLHWPYAYYHWGSRMRDDERLAAWQQMLIHECVDQGLSLHVAVGYFGRVAVAAARVQHSKTWGSPPIEVLFLHENEQPTQQLARVVVRTFHTHPYGRRLEHPLHLHRP